MPDKRTALTREGARSAIELLSQAGFDPIDWQTKVAGFKHAVACGLAGGGNEQEMIANVVKPPPDQRREVLDWLNAVSSDWSRLTAFRYPRLAQVDVNDLVMDDINEMSEKDLRELLELLRAAKVVRERRPKLIEGKPN